MLQETAKTSPYLTHFFNGLVPVNKKAKVGFGSLQTVLDDQLPAPLARRSPVRPRLTPIVAALNRYKAETTAFLGNAASATNAANLDTSLKLSASTCGRRLPFNIQALASLPQRWTGDRTNAYVKAGQYTKLAQGLDSFMVEHCTSGLSDIQLNRARTRTSRPDAPNPRIAADDFLQSIQIYAYGGEGNRTATTSRRLRATCRRTSKSIGGPPQHEHDLPAREQGEPALRRRTARWEPHPWDRNL